MVVLVVTSVCMCVCIACLSAVYCICVCLCTTMFTLYWLIIYSINLYWGLTICQALFYSVCCSLHFINNHDPKPSFTLSINRNWERILNAFSTNLVESLLKANILIYQDMFLQMIRILCPKHTPPPKEKSKGSMFVQGSNDRISNDESKLRYSGHWTVIFQKEFISVDIWTSYEFT